MHKQKQKTLFSADVNEAGRVTPGKPVKLPIYTVSSAPAASAWEGALIYVSNGKAGNPTVAFSNGTNWLVIGTTTAISAT